MPQNFSLIYAKKFFVQLFWPKKLVKDLVNKSFVEKNGKKIIWLKKFQVKQIFCRKKNEPNNFDYIMLSKKFCLKKLLLKNVVQTNFCPKKLLSQKIGQKILVQQIFGKKKLEKTSAENSFFKN